MIIWSSYNTQFCSHRNSLSAKVRTQVRVCGGDDDDRCAGRVILGDRVVAAAHVPVRQGRVVVQVQQGDHHLRMGREAVDIEG